MCADLQVVCVDVLTSGGCSAQVTLKSTVSTVVVTTLVLEGWSNKLHPDLHIMDTLRDVLHADWKQSLSKAVDSVMASGALAVV